MTQGSGSTHLRKSLDLAKERTDIGSQGGRRHLGQLEIASPLATSINEVEESGKHLLGYRNSRIRSKRPSKISQSLVVRPSRAQQPPKHAENVTCATMDSIATDGRLSSHSGERTHYVTVQSIDAHSERSSYDPGLVQRLRHKIKVSKRSSVVKIAKQIDKQKQATRRLKLIDLIQDFKQSTHGQTCYYSLNLSARQLLKLRFEYLFTLYHTAVVTQRMNLAAVKIQRRVRVLRIRKEYMTFHSSVVLIQRYVRNLFAKKNVFDVVERNKQAPVVQKYLRGYLARERIAYTLHKTRIMRHMQEFEDMFGGHRRQILETLQIRLAYLIRRRIGARKERQRIEEQKRQEAEAEAKRQALIAKRKRQKQLELKRAEQRKKEELQR